MPECSKILSVRSKLQDASQLRSPFIHSTGLSVPWFLKRIRFPKLKGQSSTLSSLEVSARKDSAFVGVGTKGSVTARKIVVRRNL